MILTENNWYSWQYDDSPLFGRYILGKKFKTNYRTDSKEIIGNYRQELIKSAKSTIDVYSGKKFTLLFSGGADSEVILRTYQSIKHPIDVVIYRYENDLNLYDVGYAVTICNMLGVPYKILNFNLHSFFENDAESYSEKSEIDRPRALPYLKFLEITDNIPILGQGDPWWFRNEGIDYSKKGTWRYGDMETFVGTGKFLLNINRPGIPFWFKWTPGLVWSYTKLKWFKKLTNDEIIGKMGVSSTKLQGYREVYPDMIERKKATGFEKIDSIVEEFERFLSIKNSGLIYRQVCSRTIDELKSEIVH